MKKYVIIRADDLGFSEAVNFGIAKTVKEGPVRTVGLMVNMRAAEHGLNLLDQAGCCIGLHSNISVGRPVCRPDEIPTLVDREGKFYPSSRYRSGEDFADSGDIYREISAQYKRFLEMTGKKPSYFEAHAVMDRKLEAVLRQVAGEYGLLYQPAFTSFRSGDKIVEMCPMHSMEEGYDARTAIRKELSRIRDEHCHVYVCHPGYLDGYLWNHSSLRLPRMDEVDMLCDPGLRLWMEQEEIVSMTYDDL